MSSVPSKSRSRLLAIGAVVLVAVAAIIAVIASQGGGDDESSASSGSAAATLSEYRQVKVSGDTLAAFAEGGTDATLGTAAPTLTGQSFDGTAMTIPSSGKATLVVFLAHWCPHCQREIPLLSKWYNEGKVPAGVDLIGVATGTSAARPNYPPSKWLKKEDVTFPVMADNDRFIAGDAYGLSSFPYFVLVGPDGTVKLRLSGEIDPDDLATRVNQALGAVS